MEHILSALLQCEFEGEPASCTDTRVAEWKAVTRGQRHSAPSAEYKKNRDCFHQFHLPEPGSQNTHLSWVECRCTFNRTFVVFRSFPMFSSILSRKKDTVHHNIINGSISLGVLESPIPILRRKSVKHHYVYIHIPYLFILYLYCFCYKL